jgi:hypothetical protein
MDLDPNVVRVDFRTDRTTHTLMGSDRFTSIPKQIDKNLWLFMDSGELGKKTTEKRGKECLTALTGIVNELEEPQIQG